MFRTAPAPQRGGLRVLHGARPSLSLSLPTTPSSQARSRSPFRVLFRPDSPAYTSGEDRRHPSGQGGGCEEQATAISSNSGASNNAARSSKQQARSSRPQLTLMSARGLHTHGTFGCSVRLGGTASLQKQRVQRLILPAQTEPSAMTAFGVSNPARPSGV